MICWWGLMVEGEGDVSCEWQSLRPFMLHLQDGPGPLKKKKKRRLDEVCVELHPQYTKNVIQSFIAQGGLRGCTEKGGGA